MSVVKLSSTPGVTPAPGSSEGSGMGGLLLGLVLAGLVFLGIRHFTKPAEPKPVEETEEGNAEEVKE